MQTSKFHSRRQGRRNLTQINTATTQKRYHVQTGSESDQRNDSFKEKNESTFQDKTSNSEQQQTIMTESQNFQPAFLPQIAMASSQGVGVEGHIIQHVVMPVPVAMGTEVVSKQLLPQSMSQDQIRLHSGIESARGKRTEGSAEDELNYYMSKEHVAFSGKNKLSRNYRNRRSSSSESVSSNNRANKRTDKKHSRSDRYSRGMSPAGDSYWETQNSDSHRYDRERSRSLSPWYEHDQRKRENSESIRYRDHRQGKFTERKKYSSQSYDRGSSRNDDRYSSRREDGHLEYFSSESRDQRHIQVRERSLENSDWGARSWDSNEGYKRGFYDTRDVHEGSCYSEEQSVRKKRSFSPVSRDSTSERYRKHKRELSPVSDSRSVKELKIHISDSGRWIESDRHSRDLSPVSDNEFDSGARPRKEYDRRMVNDHVVVDNVSEDGKYLNDTEMVSDDEQFSDDDFDNLRNWNRGEQYRSDDNRRMSAGDSCSRSRSPSAKSDGFSKSENYSRKHDSERRGRQSGPGQVTEPRKSKFALKLPNICKYYNNFPKGGCTRANCFALHVCKAYVLENCKFGEKCKKSHDFLAEQPYKVLKKLNHNLDGISCLEQRLRIMLQRRILIAYGRGDLLPVIDDKERMLDEQSEEKFMKSERKARQRSETSKTAENIKCEPKDSTGKCETKEHKENKSSDFPETLTKNSSENSVVKVENDAADAQKKLLTKVTDNTVEQDRYNRHGKGKKIATERKDLSPVSGDEGNWEDYEKYEKVSDDGMMGTDKAEDKGRDLDAVSSSDSEDGLDKPADYPAPTPQNIAVPIGQNDPLVFNRPLGNNPQSYIGPLNRPPPTVPLNPGPLFPIMGHTPAENKTSVAPMAPFQAAAPPITAVPPVTTVPPMPVLGLGPKPLPGMKAPAFLPPSAPFIPPPSRPFPNHLPSPEFLKHVIQNLPTGQNTFKNDNNPPVVKAVKTTKKKQEKTEKDPELKETVKSLWMFPHKSVVNMSIIEFVTETEAYKEEFVAEVVRLLVTLDLPYVTMKKLISVIKEKVLINIVSTTDLRKILELYPAHFKIIETVDSDDEDEDVCRKSVQIKANISLGFCEKHGFLPFAIGKCECNALHMCKFYILSNCPNKVCKFGHKLKTEHNVSVLKNHKLHRLTGEELINFMADIDSRNKWTIPGVCKYYTREKGCYKGDNTDYDTICHSLHMCLYVLKGKCTNKECERAHSIRATQPQSLLEKYGMDPEMYGDDRILKLLIDNLLEAEKDKALRNAPHRANVQKVDGVLIGQKAQAFHVGTTCDSNQRPESVPGQSRQANRSKCMPVSAKLYTNVPALCKFYQNEMGCRKKDWGPDGKCHFLHICQYFVSGECKFGNKCKRSHDLFTGQAAELLRDYNIYTEHLSVGEILCLLNQTGTPVEIPNFEGEYSKHSDVKIEVYKENTAKRELVSDIAIDSKGSAQFNVNAKPPASSVYQSCNIEEVIQHIMTEKRVDKN